MPADSGIGRHPAAGQKNMGIRRRNAGANADADMTPDLRAAGETTVTKNATADGSEAAATGNAFVRYRPHQYAQISPVAIKAQPPLTSCPRR